MKYRIKDYDIVNDICLLQRHVFWFVWTSVCAGSREKLTKIIERGD